MAYNPSAWQTKFGVSSALFTSADARTAAAVTDAPDTGEHIALVGVVLSTAAAMEIALEEETSGTEILKFHLPDNGSENMWFEHPIVLPTANKKLMIDTDTAGSVAVTAIYYSTKNGLP